MVRKKLDERIRTLFTHCLRTNQRALLLLVGDHGKDQIPNLFQILHKTADLSKTERVAHSQSVLWCYKKELGFSTHRKKRMEKIKRDKKRGLKTGGGAELEQVDNFELFLSTTDVTWCYYKDSHRVLGTTHSLLVLQDFEALTPNIMARTIETVQGGGLVVFLLRTVKSLKQLYAMSMDVHSRYRTESSGDVVPRFNERFILSLGGCANCLVCDDELNILPLSKNTLNRLTQMGTPSSSGQQTDVLSFKTEDDMQLEDLKNTLAETPHVGKLVELTKTLDQARAVLTFLEACADRDKKSKTAQSPLAGAFARGTSMTVSLTAPRGRGKSAALGLCLAGAVSFGFNSIVVTAPEPENLVAVFHFLIEGLKALKYQEHYDYTIGYNYGLDGGDSNIKGDKAGRDNIKCVVSVEVHGRGTQRQKVRYVRPTDVDTFVGAELVAVDEAAAIPLPIVRKLLQLNPCHGGKGKSMHSGDEGIDRRLTFLSSTINGYEGTGRALSLKLIKELRDSSSKTLSATDAAKLASSDIVGAGSNKGEAKVHEKRWAAESEAAKGVSTKSNVQLKELELSHPIRYSLGDPVELWLNNLLCLDCDSFDYNNTLGGQSMSDFMSLKSGAPAPVECELYHVNRDALFSYHRLSESFLQKMWGLYTSAHYKNTPNDLQMLSDAPAHNVFVLLGPTAESSDKEDALPDILAIVQTSLEGKISRKTIQAQLARGHRSAGDLIPWTMSQQFGDGNFAQLSGARVVRVAVHPEVQGLGYGSRAMELLYRYYNGEMVDLSCGDENASGSDEDGGSSDDETPSASEDEQHLASSNALIHKEALKPRKKLPPLLLPLSAIPTPRLDWLGTSFGLTPSLFNFWKRRVGMTLLYLRQTPNELTGEHSAIMIRALPRRSGWDDAWLPAFGVDARRRIGRLLGGSFRGMDVRLAVSLVGDVVGTYGVWSNEDGNGVDGEEDTQKVDKAALLAVKRRSGAQTARLTSSELHYQLTPHDLQRLEQYSRNLCDHHLISDLVSSLSNLYFTSRMGPNFQLSSVQAALLCGIGLQHKSVDDMVSELNLPINQVLAMFNKAVKKMITTFNQILVDEESKKLVGIDALRKAEKTMQNMRDVVGQTLDEDAEEGAAVAMDALMESNEGRSRSDQLNSGVTGTKLVPEIMDPDIMRYALKGTDEEWASALKDKHEVDGATVQIKRTQVKTPNKRNVDTADILEDILKKEESQLSNRKGKQPAKSSKKSRKI